MPPPVAYRDSDISAFILRKTFPLGFLFKVAVREPAANMIRSWHGSNLYSAHSIFVLGLLANRPDNGPDGIYSFGDNYINKIILIAIMFSQDLAVHGLSSSKQEFSIHMRRSRKYSDVPKLRAQLSLQFGSTDFITPTSPTNVYGRDGVPR